MAGFCGKGLSLGIGAFGLLLLTASGTAVSIYAQFATSEQIGQPGFWPTQTKYARDEYVGAQACEDCHRGIVKTQLETSMAHAAMRAGESNILEANPKLGFVHDIYRYEIRTAGGQSIYTVTDGRRARSAPLIWAFGTKRGGQSYLFEEKAGEFHEARVTYFISLGALNFTPGHAVTSPGDLDEAMDRSLAPEEVYRCFGCHTTASGIGSSFNESKLIPGVSCEACHGPGREHVAEMEGVAAKSSAAAFRAQATPAKMFNPMMTTPSNNRAIFEGQNCPTRGILLRFYPSPQSCSFGWCCKSSITLAAQSR
jgi:hypothetical protein